MNGSLAWNGWIHACRETESGSFTFPDQCEPITVCSSTAHSPVFYRSTDPELPLSEDSMNEPKELSAPDVTSEGHGDPGVGRHLTAGGTAMIGQ
jgi:hypothetical protein